MILSISNEAVNRNTLMEQLMEDAIEANVEDVEFSCMDDEDENEVFFKAICAIPDLSKASKMLQSKGYNIRKMEIGYTPIDFKRTFPNENAKDEFIETLNGLRNLDDITNVWHNADLTTIVSSSLE